MDVRDGKFNKGIKFKGNDAIGDPVEMAAFYYREGADELVFYDITASSGARDIMLKVVRKVAETIFMPLSVGGRFARALQHVRRARCRGGEGQRHLLGRGGPQDSCRGCAQLGSQYIVFGIDARSQGRDGIRGSAVTPSCYEIVLYGERKRMDIDALGTGVGRGRDLQNSIDADGTREGYKLNLIRMISEEVSITVIASGWAGVLTLGRPTPRSSLPWPTTATTPWPRLRTTCTTRASRATFY
jgi:cyclase